MQTLKQDEKKVLSHGKQVLDHEVKDDGGWFVAWMFGAVLFWGTIVYLIALSARAVQL